MIKYEFIEWNGNEIISKPLGNALSKYYVSLNAITLSIDKIIEQEQTLNSKQDWDAIIEFLLQLLASCPENERFTSKIDEW